MHAVQLASSRGLCGCFMCNILAAAGGPVAQSPAGRGIKTTSTRPAVRSGTRRGAPLSLPLLPVGQSPTSSGVRGAGLHGDHCDERRATCHPQRLRRRRPARHNAAADYAYGTRRDLDSTVTIGLMFVLQPTPDILRAAFLSPSRLAQAARTPRGHN
jgi:hypothetical protein